MSKKNSTKLIIILLIFICSALLMLTGCNDAVAITDIRISDDSVYKTIYGIDEDLSYDGIFLELIKDDSTKEKVSLLEIKGNIKVYNFSTAKEIEKLPIVIEYMNFKCSFDITVSKDFISDKKIKVTFITNSNSEIAPLEVNQYSKIEKPINPSKENFVFEGWYKETTLTNSWNFLADKVEKDTILYAKWAPVFTYTFYDLEGNFIASKQIKQYSSLVDIPKIPEKEGKTGSWDIASFDNVIANKTIYPKYVDQTFTVVYKALNDEGQNYAFNTQEGVVWGANAAIPQEDPIRSHYIFMGWEGENKNIKANTELNAKWAIEKYAVHFNLNDGVLSDADIAKHYKWDADKLQYRQDIAYNYVAIRTDATRDGYEFDGWYEDAGFIRKYDFSNTRVTSVFTLYAKWTKLYKVHFFAADPNNTGSSPVEIAGSPVLVREKEEAIPLALPQREGYSVEWSMKNFTNITEDKNVTAIYSVLKYTVKFVDFNGNELKILANENAVPYGYLIETAKTELAPTNPIRKGYTFVSWIESNSGTTFIKENTTFTAEYRINRYTVTYYNGQSTVETVSEEYDKLLTKPLIDPTKESDGKLYRFDGWCKEEGLTNKWNFETEKISDGNVNLYAKFVEQVSVTFENANGIGSHFVIKVDKGGQIPSGQIPPAPYIEGQTGRWSKTNAEFVNIQTNWTITLIYTPATYAVNFIVDSTTVSAQSISWKGMPTKPDDILTAKVGYKFKYWSKGGKEIADVTKYEITENTDFIAVYEQLPYELKFFLDRDPETKPYAIREGRYESIIGETVDTPTKNGYSFKGWLYQTDNGEKYWDWKNLVMGDMTFYADFEIKKYTIKFFNYDKIVLDATFEHFANLSLDLEDEGIASKLVRPGHKLVGWTYNNINITLDELEDVVVTSNMEISGTYSILSYIVYFDVADGSTASNFNVEVVYKNKLKKPSNPSRENYSFVGWFHGTMQNNNVVYGNKFDFANEEIVEAITLYAKWDVNIVSTEGIIYKKNDEKTAWIVTGLEEGVYNVVTIINYLEEMPVTTIGNSAFRGNTSITKIILPDTITVISPYTFEGCTGLVEINIAAEITQIGENAFANCSALKNVTVVPNSKLKVIGAFAFSDCIALSQFTFPDHLENIDEHAFDGCKSLISLIIPSTVINIGDAAFTKASSLNYIYFKSSQPPNLNGNYTFSGTSENFKIFVDNISNYTSNLSPFKRYTDIIFGVDRIDDSKQFVFTTLGNGTNLITQYIGSATKVAFPKTLMVNSNPIVISGLGDNVINANVQEMKIVGELTITNKTLNAAKNLERLELGLGDSNEFNIDGTMLYETTVNLIKLNLITIPSSIKVLDVFGGKILTANITKVYVRGNSIVEKMFESCNQIKEVYLDNTLTTIGNSAFANMPSLVSISSVSDGSLIADTLPNSLTTVGEKAFYNCAKLGSLEMKDNVTTIGNSAFERCSEITYIRLSHNDTLTIGENVLKGTAKLALLKINFIGEKKNNPTKQFVGYLFGSSTYVNQRAMIPASLTSIEVFTIILNTTELANAIFGIESIVKFHTL